MQQGSEHKPLRAFLIWHVPVLVDERGLNLRGVGVGQGSAMTLEQVPNSLGDGSAAVVIGGVAVSLKQSLAQASVTYHVVGILGRDAAEDNVRQGQTCRAPWNESSVKQDAVNQGAAAHISVPTPETSAGGGSGAIR